MGRVLRAKAVNGDLMAIFREISRNNGAAVATEQVDRIESALERLGDFPNLGREQPELRQGLRIWSASPWLVLYRLKGPDVAILRVVDGRRNLRAILRGKS